MAYSCCFSFGEHLDFAEFLQKRFIALITSHTTYTSDVGMRASYVLSALLL